jgi:hypothetical protein
LPALAALENAPFEVPPSRFDADQFHRAPAPRARGIRVPLGGAIVHQQALRLTPSARLWPQSAQA